MVDATGTTSTTFDAADEVTALNTPEGDMSYTFNAAGQRATMVESVGTTTYGMDAAGRITSLENPQSETTTWAYDSDGRLGQQTFASGVKILYSYDSRSRVTAISHQNSSSTVLSSESYSWDPASNLSAKTVDSLTTSYGYDDANQLTSESNTGYSAEYTYDANGNRASQTLNGTTYTYTNDNADKLTYVKIGGTTVKSLSYDAAGRTTGITTSAGTTSLSYDYESRVTGITYPSSATNSFSYNGLDARVGKVDSAGTSTYKRDGADVLAPVLSDGTAAYTPGVSRHASSATTFEGGDYVGTNRIETNSSQTVSGTRVIDAFGNYESTVGSPAGPFGYVGQAGYQEDGDSGLKLDGHRYYDPSTGRFLTRDVSKDDRNWYAYASGNPAGFYDPDGAQSQSANPFGIKPGPWNDPNWPWGPGGPWSGGGGFGGGHNWFNFPKYTYTYDLMNSPLESTDGFNFGGGGGHTVWWNSFDAPAAGNAKPNSLTIPIGNQNGSWFGIEIAFKFKNERLVGTPSLIVSYKF